MNNSKYILSFISFLLISISGNAQEVEMATRLRSDGKIYFVVAVMLIIFIGVAIYLFTLDRRIKKLEKK